MWKQNVSGVVDFFNDTGGYGFIESPDADEDVFFHMEDIGGPNLTEGTEVEFDIEQAAKGPKAVNVRRSQSNQLPQPATGTVDFFNDTGRYGFIKTSAVDEDVFFHMEDIGGPDLTEGTQVEFVVEQADKGPKAINVQRISADSAGLDQDTATTDDTEIYDETAVDQESEPDTAIYTGDDTGTTGDYPPFCSNCGTELTEISNPTFCPNCGTEL